jgi:hypothetical protein
VRKERQVLLSSCNCVAELFLLLSVEAISFIMQRIVILVFDQSATTAGDLHFQFIGVSRISSRRRLIALVVTLCRTHWSVQRTVKPPLIGRRNVQLHDKQIEKIGHGNGVLGDKQMEKMIYSRKDDSSQFDGIRNS